MLKESYFTAGTLSRETENLLADLSPYVRNRGPILNADHAALLVLDMQRYFLDPACHAYAPSSDAIMPGIVSLMDAFARLHRPVICTRHLDDPDPTTPMLRWWRGRVEEHDPMSAIDDRVASRATHVMQKTAYDAFLGTGLDALLREHAASQIVVVGVLTHLCVESTARGAFMRGFDVAMPVDGSATYTRELHCGSLRGLAHGFANINTVSDCLKAITK